jgi:hypothetical protein
MTNSSNYVAHSAGGDTLTTTTDANPSRRPNRGLPSRRPNPSRRHRMVRNSCREDGSSPNLPTRRPNRRSLRHSNRLR